MHASPPRSPVPQEVSAELRRVVDRWRQLPEAVAAERAPLARALVADLAAETAGASGRVGSSAVPDLGVAAIPDQLAVLVHDASGAGVPRLGERLADLRRALWPPADMG